MCGICMSTSIPVSFKHVPRRWCSNMSHAIYIYTYSDITYSNNTPIPITIPIELTYSNNFPTIFYQCFNNIIVSWYSTQIPNIFQDDSHRIIVWTVIVGLIFSHNSCLDRWHMPIAIYWASLCCANNITIFLSFANHFLRFDSLSLVGYGMWKL